MEKTNNAIPTWKQFNRPWYVKFGLAIWNYIRNVALMIWSVIKAIPFKIRDLVFAIGRGCKGLWLRFRYGDWRTKISYLIMGFGCFTRKKSQIVKGLLLLAVEALYVLFIVFFSGKYLAKFGTLGTQKETIDLETGELLPGDNSLQILIMSVISILLTVFLLIMWIKNTKICYDLQMRAKEGKPLPTMKQQINYLLNDGYHTTILILPIFGVLFITVLPLICNILVAFTNYDSAHISAANPFVWTGFDSFKMVFSGSYGTHLWRVLGWTLIWAVFATFTNFFFGMFLAMMINKKSIKLKAFWRIAFVLVIAIPDFVSLLLMSKFFGYGESTTITGPFNKILVSLFGENANIDWWSSNPKNSLNTTLPKIMVIVVNMWRGMPYTMLATSGILMNIPEELYESSRIDGAGPVRRYISITFPYIMFVMGPQLITTFTGNINNFNVIFFLTGGGPNIYSGGLGATDLLITWLYKLTVNNGNKQYNLGAVIGIFTFLISSFFALIVFNSSKSIKQEDTFQ